MDKENISIEEETEREPRKISQMILGGILYAIIYGGIGFILYLITKKSINCI